MKTHTKENKDPPLVLQGGLETLGLYSRIKYIAGNHPIEYGLGWCLSPTRSPEIKVYIKPLAFPNMSWMGLATCTNGAIK